MSRLTVTAAVLMTVAAVVLSDSAVEEPMVAFVCNRPAMHSTNKGWVRDETTSCIKDPIDILNYCRKIYPERDVWNVVESSEMVTIRNWCNFGHTKCRHRFTVRPFRCLVGAFQSEALQVPERCVFDHVHGPGATGGADCQSSSAWNRTARQACIDRHAGSQLHGFAVLQPCGIDGFGGVEFVCCPAANAAVPATASMNAVAPSGGHHRWRQTTRSYKTRQEATTVHRLPPKTTTVPTTVSTMTTRTTTVTTVTPTTAEPTTLAARVEAVEDDADDENDDDEYEKKSAAAAGSQVTDSAISEHERFTKAKAELEKRHHEKVAKMMKEWAAARRRVQEIKNIDMKGGEKFNREMTARFQKAYESLERDTAADRKKLMSEHQLRVEDELSRKKTQAMDSYMTALSNPQTDATKILNTLVQYVKAEQKDRVHTINHYEHVEESDPVEAETQRAAVAAHLRGIDERVTQAIEMLSRVPKYEKKIRQQIERFLSSYQSLDESLAVIMAKINEKTNGNRAAPSRPTSPQQQPGPLASPQQTTESATGTTLDNLSTTQDTTPIDDATVAVDTSADVIKQTTIKDATAAVTDFTSKMAVKEAMTTMTQTTSEEHHFVELKPIVEQAAHNQKSDLVVLENYIKKLPMHADSASHMAAPLAIVACGVAVFVIVVVGVSLVRRRSVGMSPEAAGCSRSVTEIDRSVRPAPADARVPINGYENPTYQYYAQAEAAAVAPNVPTRANKA